MKRKHESDLDSSRPETSITSKVPRVAVSPTSVSIHSHFRPGLFTPECLLSYQSLYRSSTPYRHGVIPSLLSDALLRDVRSEIQNNISFTSKETDIYKLEQSGDLANLSGLPLELSKRLPNLARLRDALYSTEFRGLLEAVTGVGRLSGQKADMAINVYRPGSYLLCHDDVIGSRRLSYILYLTDPEEPWKPEWGGNLRLYDTEKRTNEDGKEVLVPSPEHIRTIPPSWGQLAFFAVEPGKSFHDVEEVYHPDKGRDDEREEKKRVRMAISGWYHIPQPGEDGYEEGLERRMAERSSLAQLQGKAADEFDEPRTHFRHFHAMDSRQSTSDREGNVKVVQDTEAEADDDDTILSEEDLTFLLQYITPSYLTPEMTEELSSNFEENSVMQLDCFLCKSFANELREFVLRGEAARPVAGEIPNHHQDSVTEWKTARPPHKHRFLFQQDLPAPNHQQLQQSASSLPSPHATPISRLLCDLFPSHAFRKWLSLITGLEITAAAASIDVLARRFRRGMDYALATGYSGPDPRLEFTLGCTSAGVREREQRQQEEVIVDDGDRNDGHGGQEVYMALDDDNDLKGPSKQIHDDPAIYKANPTWKPKSKPTQNPRGQANTRPNNHVKPNETEADQVDKEEQHADDDDDLKERVEEEDQVEDDDQPMAEDDDDEDDNDDDCILFTDSTTSHFNSLSVVLRDAATTLRMVKYLDRAAAVDRWDVKGVVEGLEGFAREGEDENEEEDEEEEEVEGTVGKSE